MGFLVLVKASKDGLVIQGECITISLLELEAELNAKIDNLANNLDRVLNPEKHLDPAYAGRSDWRTLYDNNQYPAPDGSGFYRVEEKLNPDGLGGQIARIDNGTPGDPLDDFLIFVGKEAEDIPAFLNNLAPDVRKVADDFVTSGGRLAKSGDEVVLFAKKTDDAGKEIVEEFARLKPKADGSGFELKITNEKITGTLDEGQLAKLTDDVSNDATLLKAMADDPDLAKAWGVLENSAKRTDLKTLKFFDDPNVIASRQKVLAEKIDELFPDIPLEELTAIHHYTTNAHKNLNKALRGEIPMTDEYRAFEELLNAGMDKLPKYSGDKVFRGVSGQEAALAKTWKVGDDVSFSDFKSSSVKREVAVDDFTGDVMYEITNPKGHDIKQISEVLEEAEVLFRSGSTFKVKEIKPDFIVYDKDFNPITVRKIILEFIE